MIVSRISCGPKVILAVIPATILCKRTDDTTSFWRFSGARSFDGVLPNVYRPSSTGTKRHVSLTGSAFSLLYEGHMECDVLRPRCRNPYSQRQQIEKATDRIIHDFIEHSGLSNDLRCNDTRLVQSSANDEESHCRNCRFRRFCALLVTFCFCLVFILSACRY